MLFTGLGRSVLGETVPSAYGLGRYQRPRAQFLSIRTSQPVNNIYLFHTSFNSRLFLAKRRAVRFIISTHEARVYHTSIARPA